MRHLICAHLVKCRSTPTSDVHLKAWTKPQRMKPIWASQAGPPPGSLDSRSQLRTSSHACARAQRSAAATATAAPRGLAISDATAMTYAAHASCATESMIKCGRFVC